MPGTGEAALRGEEGGGERKRKCGVDGAKEKKNDALREGGEGEMARVWSEWKM